MYKIHNELGGILTNTGSPAGNKPLQISLFWTGGLEVSAFENCFKGLLLIAIFILLSIFRFGIDLFTALAVAPNFHLPWRCNDLS